MVRGLSRFKLNFCRIILLISTATAFSATENDCEIRIDCYHIRLKTPQCGLVILPTDITGYTVEIEVSGCKGWSQDDLFISWQEELEKGENLEFKQCRNQLRCYMDGTWLHHHTDHFFSVWIKLLLINKTVHLPAHIAMKDMHGLKNSRKKSGEKKKSFDDPISYSNSPKKSKETRVNRRHMWGKIDHNGIYDHLISWKKTNKAQKNKSVHSEKRPEHALKSHPDLWGHIEDGRRKTLYPGKVQWNVGLSNSDIQTNNRYAFSDTSDTMLSLEEPSEEDSNDESLENASEEDIESNSLEEASEENIAGNSLEEASEEDIAGNSLEASEEGIEGNSFEEASDKGIEGNSLEEASEEGIEGNSLEEASEEGIEGNSLEEVSEEGIEGNSLEEASEEGIEGNSLEEASEEGIEGNSLEEASEEGIQGNSFEEASEEGIEGNSLEEASEEGTEGNSLEEESEDDQKDNTMQNKVEWQLAHEKHKNLDHDVNNNINWQMANEHQKNNVKVPKNFKEGTLLDMANEDYGEDLASQNLSMLSQNEEWQLRNEDVPLHSLLSNEEWQSNNEKRGHDMHTRKPAGFDWHVQLGNHNDKFLHGKSQWNYRKGKKGKQNEPYIHIDLSINDKSITRRGQWKRDISNVNKLIASHKAKEEEYPSDQHIQRNLPSKWQKARENIPLNKNSSEKKHLVQNKQSSGTRNKEAAWHMAVKNYLLSPRFKTSETKRVPHIENDINWQMKTEKHQIARGKGADLIINGKILQHSRNIKDNINYQMALERNQIPTSKQLSSDRISSQQHHDIQKNINWQIKNENLSPFFSRNNFKPVESNINWQMAMEKGEGRQIKKPVYKNIKWQMVNEEKNANKFSDTSKTSLQHDMGWQVANENRIATKSMDEQRNVKHLLNSSVNWQMKNENHPEKMHSGALQRDMSWQLGNEKLHTSKKTLDQNINWHMENEKHPLKTHSDALQQDLNWQTVHRNHHTSKFSGNKPINGKVYRIYDNKNKVFRVFCVTKDDRNIAQLRECDIGKIVDKPKLINQQFAKHPRKNLESFVCKVKNSKSFKTSRVSSQTVKCQGNGQHAKVFFLGKNRNNENILSEVKADLSKIFYLFNLTNAEIKNLENISKKSAEFILEEARQRKNLTPDGKYVQAKVGMMTGNILKMLFNNSYLASKKAIKDSHIVFSDNLHQQINKGSNKSMPSQYLKSPGNVYKVARSHWSTWQVWSTCSVSCGIGGIEKRFRQCVNGQQEMKTCVGTAVGVRPCRQHQLCPDASHWSVWSSWIHCSVTCGDGYSIRSRSCSKPKLSPSNCLGQSSQVKPCTVKPCVMPTTKTTVETTSVPKVVFGSWSSWTSWSDCSANCGLGKKSRQRQCGPEYLHRLFPKTEIKCIGDKNHTKSCILNSCESDSSGFVHEVLVGEDTILHCAFNEDVDVNKIYWITPSGNKVTSKSQDERYEVIDGSLHLKRAQREDKGTYHCVVKGHYAEQLASDAVIYVKTCHSDPCHNGGTCLEEEYHHTQHKHVKCLCSPGYEGTYCQKQTHISHKQLLVASLSILAAAGLISASASFVICCRYKKSVSVRFAQDKPEGSNIERKRIRSASCENLKNRKSEKENGRAFSKYTPPVAPVHKNFNTSIVSSDDSFVEINEKDFKHFREDHIYDMYNKLGTHTHSSPAVLSKEDSTKQKLSCRSRPQKSNSQEFDQLYENVDTSYLKHMEQVKTNFHVNYLGNERQKYHVPENQTIEITTPVKNITNSGFNNPAFDQMICQSVEQDDKDFEMVHHIQDSPLKLDLPYGSSATYEEPKVHLHDVSNNKYSLRSDSAYNGSSVQGSGNERPYSSIIPDSMMNQLYQDVYMMDNKQICPCKQSNFQCTIDKGESTQSTLDNSSHQILLEPNDLINFHGEDYSIPEQKVFQLTSSETSTQTQNEVQDSTITNTSKNENEKKSQFSLELDDLLDNFCEPIDTEINETTSSETVQEVSSKHTLNFSKDSKRQEIDNAQNCDYNSYSKEPSHDRNKQTDVCSNTEGIRKTLVDLSNTDTQNCYEDTALDEQSFQSESDSGTLSPLMSPSLKSPGNRMCVGHFQMVYGPVSFKSPRNVDGALLEDIFRDENDNDDKE